MLCNVIVKFEISNHLSFFKYFNHFVWQLENRVFFNAVGHMRIWNLYIKKMESTTCLMITKVIKWLNVFILLSFCISFWMYHQLRSNKRICLLRPILFFYLYIVLNRKIEIFFTMKNDLIKFDKKQLVNHYFLSFY